MRIRIFAIFKNPIYISALEPFLRSNGMDVVATCSNINLAIDQYKRLEVDLVMMDYNWRDTDSDSGESLIRQLKNENPNVRIIVFTSFFDSWVLPKLKMLGVQGYFFKNMEDILEQLKQCILKVSAGEIYYATQGGNRETVMAP